MRWILKIILFPIILLLSILTSFLKFIISVSGIRFDCSTCTKRHNYFYSSIDNSIFDKSLWIT